MAVKAMLVVLTVAVVIMAMKGTTTAETFIVGDADGWRFPSSIDFYSSWASKHTFAKDDTLEFDFQTAFHTVAMVTSKDEFDKCDDKNAKLFNDGPLELTLNTTGKAFFFCTISNHCSRGGMKFSINVVGGEKTSPSPEAAKAPTSVDGASKISPGPSVVSPSPHPDSKGNVASLPTSTLLVSLVVFVFMALIL